MKKNILFIALLAMLKISQNASAQYIFTKSDKVDEFGVFQHVGLGVFAGTSGWGVELGTPITDYLQLRAGYAFNHDFSADFDVHYTSNNWVRDETEAEAKLKTGGFHALLDIYPSSEYTFHFTTGLFFGKERAFTAENKEPIKNGGGGLEIGDYIVGFDQNGIAHAAIEVKKVRPYVGLGFGRLVPRSRVSFSFDMGVQFWGTPTVYGLSENGKDWTKVTSKSLDNKDEGFIDILSDVKVYPVLKFTLSGRIF